MKPRVFIGSSTEGLDIAHAVQSNLESAAEVTIWSQDVFLPGAHILESLLRQAEKSDFAVFVFSTDDIVASRGSEQLTVRDNVVFELGLCIGLLGPKRSFMIMPQVQNLRIPSDLSGINAATFDPKRSDKDLVAALGPACNKIRTAMKAPNERPLEPELRLPVLLRNDLLTPNMFALLMYIESHGPCTRNQIDSAFHEYGNKELYYRLEVLRLLSLISIQVDTKDSAAAVISVHPDYKAARMGQHLMEPRSTGTFARPMRSTSELADALHAHETDKML
jgi:hypothetical protein